MGRRAATAALVALVAVATGACGGGGSGSAAAPTDAPSAGGSQPPAATATVAPSEGAVAEVLGFEAPLLSGGTLDGTTLAGRDVAFWFWAPW